MFAWLERFRSGLVAAAAAAGLLLMAYLRGRGDGQKGEREGQAVQINKQAAQARKEVRHVQDQTAGMGDDVIAAELKRDWVRGTGSGGR